MKAQAPFKHNQGTKMNEPTVTIKNIDNISHTHHQLTEKLKLLNSERETIPEHKLNEIDRRNLRIAPIDKYDLCLPESKFDSNDRKIKDIKRLKVIEKEIELAVMHQTLFSFGDSEVTLSLTRALELRKILEIK